MPYLMDEVPVLLRWAGRKKSVDELLALLPSTYGIGHGFWMGDGGDLFDVLTSAGWRCVQVEADYYWCLESPASTGEQADLVSYVEGDLYRGNVLLQEV